MVGWTLQDRDVSASRRASRKSPGNQAASFAFGKSDTVGVSSFGERWRHF